MQFSRASLGVEDHRGQISVALSSALGPRLHLWLQITDKLS